MRPSPQTFLTPLLFRIFYPQGSRCVMGFNQAMLFKIRSVLAYTGPAILIPQAVALPAVQPGPLLDATCHRSHHRPLVPLMLCLAILKPGTVGDCLCLKARPLIKARPLNPTKTQDSTNSCLVSLRTRWCFCFPAGSGTSRTQPTSSMPFGSVHPKSFLNPKDLSRHRGSQVLK